MTAERITCDDVPAHRFRGASLRTQTPVGWYLARVGHAAKLIVEGDGGQHFEPAMILRHTRQDACLTAQVGLTDLNAMRNKTGVREAAVALAGSPAPCPALLPKRGRGPGHAGREDAP